MWTLRINCATTAAWARNALNAREVLRDRTRNSYATNLPIEGHRDPRPRQPRHAGPNRKTCQDSKLLGCDR
eukprot:7044487-Alexandrium_andersonii.AAC.1